MCDYEKYVSFEVPQGVDASLFPMKPLKGELLDKVKVALSEIVQTPEGEELLKNVAAMGPDGKVNITFNANRLLSITLAIFPHDILIGSMDASMRYEGAKWGKDLHQVTLQRVLYHELQHHALGHAEIRGDEGVLGISPSKESEAIKATNQFMKKYYGSPNRHKDGTKGDWDLNAGKQEWKLSEDFKGVSGKEHSSINPEHLKKQILNLTPDEAFAMGPEVESLYEVRNHPEHYRKQLDALLEHPEKIEEAYVFLKSQEVNVVQNHEKFISPNLSIILPIIPS